MDTKRFVRLTEFCETYGFHPQTCHVWRAEGKYPDLFSLAGSRVFVDLDAWEKILVAGKGKTLKKHT